MAEVSIETVLQLTGSLGTFGIVIWLFIRAQSSIKEKDEYLKEINNKLMLVFENNARVNENLSQSIKANTEATNTLTERVTNILLNKKQN